MESGVSKQMHCLIRSGRINVYKAHAPSTAQEPLLTFVLDPAAKITKHGHRPGLMVRGAVATQFDNDEEIMPFSQNVADSDTLLAMLHRANPKFPVSRDDLETASGSPPATKAHRGEEGLAAPTLSAEKVGSDSEPDQALDTPQRSTEYAQVHPGLSALQLKMQRLNEAASRFNLESPEHQAAIIRQLGDDGFLPTSTQPLNQGEESDWTI
ncbi:hypothetical protein BU25DRAFT_456015 [Macroventuria anomochaeta]|uniref:Uncharacterized protein n=1 Tax=Macroventuria anomochaeta TaxID=301207 RepID=A0ACB6S9J2_9PLEO|nr:uncharacterized protein BU25DRAFT_456015 [Macroventuria anomochaeta]KAF2630250.1 hypothetical protein BU25DRAFT_456015 [Macroventuria anomochaeta]